MRTNARLNTTKITRVFNPADAQLIREAKAYPTFLLDLLAKSFTEVKRLKEFEPTPKPDKDYTTNCAILCGEEPFIKFLQDQHNLQSTSKESVAKKVRELCQISSRKQLNQSMDKADNWRRLSREFEGWMQSGGAAPSQRMEPSPRDKPVTRNPENNVDNYGNT